MVNRKERRAAAHAARKAARNSRSPTTSSEEPEVASESVISEARLAANRANAQHSTGAKSEATRATSAQNHTIHGLARHDNTNFKILTSEDPAAFASLKKSLEDEHKPVTETEIILVNRMVESEWLARRAQRLQDTFIHPDSGLATDEKQFNLYKRYKTTHDRAFHKCLNDLLKLRSERRKSNLGFEAQRLRTEIHEMQKDFHGLKLSMEENHLCLENIKVAQEFMRASRENPGFEAQFGALFVKKQAA